MTHSVQTPLIVTAEEAGLKLVRFLERRLSDAPGTGQLHKWIRTGQVRVNKKRAQPFALVQQGDEVRLPPFAVARTMATTLPQLGDNLPLLAHLPDLLVLAKPAGLPVQGGSKVDDSVASRLRHAFAGHAYIPAPVHRLDKHTSGILLAATSHTSAQTLSGYFSTPGCVHKEYVALVSGKDIFPVPHLLVDTLEKRLGPDGQERMYSVANSQSILLNPQDIACNTPSPLTSFLERADHDQLALTVVQRREGVRLSTALHRAVADACLLHVCIYTGRTHQIRAQLAHRGYPLVGDTRYGGVAAQRLYLHACKVTLPTGQMWECPFSW